MPSSGNNLYLIYLCQFIVAVFIALTVIASDAEAGKSGKSGKFSIPDPLIEFDVPKLEAGNALNRVAKQAEVQMLFDFEIVENIKTNEVSGSYTTWEALLILLEKTGLKPVKVDQDMYSIVPGNIKNWRSKVVKKNVKNIVGSALAVLAVSGAPYSATAQEGDNANKSRYTLEELIVTARRVEEGLQDAAISVTAISALELENRGALDVIDVADVAPNVSLKSDGNTSGFAAAPRVSIRGVGQSDFVINTDPAVGIYADGVYLGRSLGSVLDLVDVERVEALRGPQGTLFGRNSIGGAINVIAKKPVIGGGYEGYFSAAAGEEGYLLLRGSTNIPLSETSAARVSVMRRERDGFIDALNYDNLQLGESEVTGIRAAFQWQPTSAFTVDIDADFSDHTSTAAPVIPVVIGDLSAGATDLNGNPLGQGPGPEQDGVSTSVFARRFNGEAFTPPVPPVIQPFTSTDPQCATSQAFRDSSLTCVGNAFAATRDGTNSAWFDLNGNLVRPDDQSLESYGFSGRLTYQTESFTLKSISAWRGFDSSFLNGAPTPIAITTNDNEVFDVDQFSQEFTINGGERVRWIAGVFYQEEDGNERVRTIFPLAPPSGGNDPDFLPTAGIEDRIIDNTSEAIFGQLSFDLAESLELTVGARYTEEEKLAIVSTITGSENAAPRVVEGLAEIEETTVLVNLAWNVTDDVLIYGQFSDGFRNGGFPPRLPPGSIGFQEFLFEPEFVDTFEIGIKATALDGRLRANLSFFSSDYEDQQIDSAVFDEGLGDFLGVVQNVGESTIDGFELEGSYLVNDNFRLDLALGFLDTEVTGVNNEGGFIISEGTNVAAPVSANAGFELPYSPEWQINLGANYSFFLANNAEVRNRVDVIYEAEQFGSVANRNIDFIPSTTRVNYILTYVPQDAPWELSLGARNLFDEEDFSSVVVGTGPPGAIFHTQTRGREAYLQFKYNFGQ